MKVSNFGPNEFTSFERSSFHSESKNQKVYNFYSKQLNISCPKEPTCATFSTRHWWVYQNCNVLWLQKLFTETNKNNTSALFKTRTDLVNKKLKNFWYAGFLSCTLGRFLLIKNYCTTRQGNQIFLIKYKFILSWGRYLKINIV